MVLNETVMPLVFVKKDLTFGFLDIVGFILITMMIILANAGGLGGGGTLTPFMLIFLRLSIFECVPLANFFGFVAAATRFIINFKQKHPNPKKEKDGKLAIEYEIITLTMPILYLGTFFGVQINTVINEWCLVLILFLVLGFVAYKMTQKAISTYKKENIKIQMAAS